MTNGAALGVAFSSPTLDVVTANEVITGLLTAETIDFESQTVDTLVATTGTITTLGSTTGTIATLNSTTGTITTLGSTTGTIATLNSTTGTITTLGSTTANITTGNITTGNVTNLNQSGLGAVSVSNAVSAAGTNQATATPLTATVNNVSTVASGTGVNLPASAAGRQITIQNNGANTLTVYPAQGASDTINGLAATVGVKLVPGVIATFNATAAGAWNVQGLPNHASAFNTNNATTAATLTAANVSGGYASVDLQMTGAMAGDAALTLPLVSDLVAALPNASASTSYRLRITNASSNAQTWTVTTNTGWTLAGTMTIAQNTWREFIVTFTSTSAATLQSVAVGTYS
jgi:hypothetical protein